MNVNIDGKEYVCSKVVVDNDKTTVYYGTYAEDGLENKTDIIGDVTIVGDVSCSIDWLKKQLSDTDYVVIKIAEGAAKEEAYSDVIAQRQIWRNKLKLLEKS